MAKRPTKAATIREAKLTEYCRLAQLALQAAEASGDRKLYQLVELAIQVDYADLAVGIEPDAGIWRGTRQLNAVERWAARASRWQRVWMHLAGRDVSVMGTSGRPHGAVWVYSWVKDERGGLIADARSAFSWEITPETSRVSLEQARGSARDTHRAAVKALAGQGWFEVAWGEFGTSTPKRAREAALPHGQDAALRAIQEATDRALREAQRYVRDQLSARNRGRSRARLDHHLPEFVVYLLRQGHGALRGEGPRGALGTFKGFKGVEGGKEFSRPFDLLCDASDLRAMERLYQAARRLVDLANVWPSP